MKFKNKILYKETILYKLSTAIFNTLEAFYLKISNTQGISC